MIRKPVVAGQFYPDNKEQIHAFIDAAVEHYRRRIKAKAVILPHAGYLYSGRTAARTSAQVDIPNTVMLLGPNHSGLGHPFSLYHEGAWETPLGTVAVNTEITQAILEMCEHVTADTAAHRCEHSLEVLIPFLQFANPSVSIVPLTVGTHDLGQLRTVAMQLAKIIKSKQVLIVTSSDMTHYESQKSAEAKDKKAIEAICGLDEEHLIKVVQDYDISMCGVIPAYMTIIIAKELGAFEGDLVEYCTSGDVTGDYNQVVGYAGMIIK